MKIGDRVEIVKYGCLGWVHKEMWKEMRAFDNQVKSRPGHILVNTKEAWAYDMCHEIVGQTGVIDGIEEIQGKKQYSLDGPAKVAWYDEEQLQLKP